MSWAQLRRFAKILFWLLTSLAVIVIGFRRQEIIIYMVAGYSYATITQLIFRQMGAPAVQSAKGVH
jgi:hypothetical protein